MASNHPDASERRRSRSGSGSYGLSNLYIGSGQRSGSGLGRGREPGQAGSVERVNPVQQPSSGSSDPFRVVPVVPSYHPWPKDPKQEGRVVNIPPAQPRRQKGTLQIDREFFRSSHPGVAWHEGVLLNYSGEGKHLPVIIRVIWMNETDEVFMAWLAVEKRIMGKLKHKYILNSIKTQEGNAPGKGPYGLIAFPVCRKKLDNRAGDMETLIRTMSDPFEEKDVVRYMGQIAQALA